MFVNKIPDMEEKSGILIIPYFLYFLTIVIGKPGAMPRNIDECFDIARIPRYKYTKDYLSRNTKSKSGKKPLFIRTENGYILERFTQNKIEEEIGISQTILEIEKTLEELNVKVKSDSEHDFLEEAILCFNAGAHRAAIVMVWILTLDHLYEYILNHSLSDFNVELQKRKDKRIKISKISKKDDFSEIPEATFIEICRAAKIITNDVRKILDVKLGIRNSCAHPSGIKIPPVKANEFIQDLVINVILKYE